eukprot:3645454-Rhodomonas_salina.1
MNNVRTRARVAAAQAEHQAQQDQVRVEEENEPRNEAPRIDPAEQIAREQAAIEQLAEAPGGAYLDEPESDQVFVMVGNDYILYCGHAIAGDKKANDILPDPRTWEEAMSAPDWREWIEAAKAERQNLKNHKTFEVLSKSKVRDLIRSGVRIHTCRN